MVQLSHISKWPSGECTSRQALKHLPEIFSFAHARDSIYPYQFIASMPPGAIRAHVHRLHRCVHIEALAWAKLLGLSKTFIRSGWKKRRRYSPLSLHASRVVIGRAAACRMGVQACPQSCLSTARVPGMRMRWYSLPCAVFQSAYNASPQCAWCCIHSTR